MKSFDIRKFTRVPFNRKANLDFAENRYTDKPITDLSLEGINVKGNFNQEIGDTCTIQLIQDSPSSKIILSATGRIVRIQEDGISLQFVSMKLDSFIYLQTTIIYLADDPLKIGTEFISDFAFTIEDE